MDRFTLEELQELLERQDVQPCLSIYMRTHRKGREVQKNSLRFRNLLKQAADRLAEFGFRGLEAEALLDQAQNRLLLDESFWQRQSDGLALFSSPDLFRYYRLPSTFDELVMVGERFYVRPLAPLIRDEGRFYLLAISRDNIRLMEGDREHLEDVPVERMPESLAEALEREFAEEQDQSQQVSKPRTGNRGRSEATFHGHGIGNDDEEGQVLQYFHRVDRGICDFLAGTQIPLVLAGVEYLHPMYRLSNDYSHLLEPGITGSPDDIRMEELHARAWEIVAPRYGDGREDAAALYARLKGKETGRASKDLEEIVQSAYGGRVGQLFIPRREYIWGRYDMSENRVEVHPERRPESEDLLDTAAFFTLANNGEVYTDDIEKMPEQSFIAAIFRY
jgi:hypothetical protein